MICIAEVLRHLFFIQGECYNHFREQGRNMLRMYPYHLI